MKINKFRIRIFLLNTVSLVLPVLLCCIILLSITESAIKNYTYNDNALTLKANVQNIESKLDTLDRASTSLMINLAQIPEVMEGDQDLSSVNIFSSTEYAFTVQSSLIVDTYTVSGFRYYYLYFPKRSLLIVSKMSFFDNVNYNTLDALVIPENQWGVSTPYNNLISNPMIGKYITERNISKNYTTKDKNGNEIFLTANLSEEYLSRQFRYGIQYKPNYAIIIDSYGNIISSLEKSEIGDSVNKYHQMLANITADPHNQDYREISLNGTRYMLNWEYSPENDWYFITALDVSVVTNSISAILDTMFIMIMCLLLFSLLITIFLVRSTTKPFNELADAMTQMKNQNFKVQIKADHYDEFGVIYNGFNEMAQEIDSLVHSIKHEQNLKTETHIRLLQSEINPHMLYNSLESLYSMAKMSKQNDMANLVMALSKFFRISLSGGKRVVPFRDAFELAYQYIIVQNIRLNYCIDFQYHISENLMEMLTPKFLLQPIVENTFQYGFKNKRANCTLLIKAIEDKDCVKIIVRDNGIGIHEMALIHINQNINDFNFEKNPATKGYALRNINYQLKLKYGNEYGLDIESVYGEYTQVNIRIPKTKEGNSNV